MNNKTFVFQPVFSPEDIDKSYQKVLKSIQSNYEAKGFRKGRTPLQIIKSEVSETHIIEEVLTRLISDYYTSEIAKKDLHPIIEPQIKVLNPPLTFDKEWQIEITGCELPEITIDPKYREEIKKINKLTVDDHSKLNSTIEVLINHSRTEIPEMLIKADVDNKLSQLVDQTQQAGLTVTQYLKTKNQSLEQYQDLLQKQVKNEWITNLAIDRIARDEHLHISQQEVDELISRNKELAKNLNLVYYLLTQQKVFDYLKKL